MGKGIVKLGEGNWAVKDGNLLAAKETNGRFKNAEFTVARGTRATYVGRDGLIKDSNLQDANLVQNGDFEELSDDYIINPTFDTSIPFGTNGSGWKTIDTSSDNGTIEFFNGGIRMTRIGSNLKRLRATLPGGGQNVIPSTVETYKIQYEVISATDDNSLSGIYFGGASISASSVSSSVGVHTIYAQSGGSNGIIQFQSIPNKELVLDNISVKQVDPNDRWNVSSYDTVIEDGVAKFPTTNGSFLIQSNVVPASVKQYKLQYDVVETNGGNLRLSGGSSAFGTIPLNSSLGTHTFYLQSNGAQTNLQFNNQSSFVGSIDNVVVQEIKTDTPRIDFTDNTDGHLLLEPQSTNLINYSEDFSSGSGRWNAIDGASVDPNYAVSPNGTQDAWKFNYDGTTNGRVETYVSSGITAQQSITFSVWLKTLSGTKEVIIGHSAWGLQAVNVTNEWQRFTYTVTATTNFGYPRVRMDSEGSILVWGYQLEQLPYATSYIPTNGSQVTRDAETCINAGEPADFNNSEGVLYFEGSKITTGYTYMGIGISDGSADNLAVIKFRNTGSLIWAVHTGNTNSTIIQHTPTDISANNKIALKWDSSKMYLYVNGVKIDELNIGASISNGALDRLNFNAAYTNFENFYGKCKTLRVYKEALSDSELTTLTS